MNAFRIIETTGHILYERKKESPFAVLDGCLCVSTAQNEQGRNHEPFMYERKVSRYQKNEKL